MFLEKFSLPIGWTLGLAFVSWNCDWLAIVPRTDACYAVSAVSAAF